MKDLNERLAAALANLREKERAYKRATKVLKEARDDEWNARKFRDAALADFDVVVAEARDVVVGEADG